MRLIGNSATTPITVAVRVDNLVSVFVAQTGVLLLPHCCHEVPASNRSLSTFLHICRYFLSGGTRIRTGDTMIFSHIQKPLEMRKTRMGKRIYVQAVPLDTSWFCPYCCATVDTAFVTSAGQISASYHRKSSTA